MVVFGIIPTELDLKLSLKSESKVFIFSLTE